MFIIDDFISWIINRILDRIFPKKNDNQALINTLLDKIEKLHKEQSDSNENFQKEKERRALERTRILESLKRSGISVEKLIRRYDKPLSAIIISYASQKQKNKSGYYENSTFLRAELEKFNSKYLGGTDVMIPPANVPPWIKNYSDLKKWLEDEILKGRYCKIKFLALIDLRKQVFWGTYLPYDQKKPMHFTLGEVLNVDDIFKEIDINKIALSQVILEGDIAWLASSTLIGDDLKEIFQNQQKIENSLGNPSLRMISKDDMVSKIIKVLPTSIQKRDEVAKAIVEEAKFWEARLK